MATYTSLLAVPRVDLSTLKFAQSTRKKLKFVWGRPRKVVDPFPTS